MFQRNILLINSTSKVLYKLTVALLAKKFSVLWGNQWLVPYWQQPATSAYREACEFSTHCPNHIDRYFNIIIFFQVVLFLEVQRPICIVYAFLTCPTYVHDVLIACVPFVLHDVLIAYLPYMVHYVFTSCDPYVLHYMLISSTYFVKSTNYEAHIRMYKYQNIWAFFSAKSYAHSKTFSFKATFNFHY